MKSDILLRETNCCLGEYVPKLDSVRIDVESVVGLPSEEGSWKLSIVKELILVNIDFGIQLLHIVAVQFNLFRNF